jgi:2-keto-4-pentenoate hydratase/2-oxohepta-3-ene-1,7-dioic acid hydratase in catechol pathway
MYWCTYSTAGSSTAGTSIAGSSIAGASIAGAADPRAGLVLDGRVHGINARLIEIIGSASALERAADTARNRPAEVVSLDDATLHAPIPVPPSIRDFMAFEEHVVATSKALNLEVHPDWYQIPVFYFTNPAAVRGPNDDVEISPGSSAFDFELEIAAVIGTPGADIAEADAERHIAGYTILCDWSARDLQEREMRLRLGPAKGKDSATSLGPVLVTPDELEPLRAGQAYDLAMTASVNGKPYSAGNFSTIYWSFRQLVAHASRGTELRTGDVIGSGTVGTGCILELSRTHGPDAFPWLVPGDVVELEIAKIGTIRATIRPSQT